MPTLEELKHAAVAAQVAEEGYKELHRASVQRRRDAFEAYNAAEAASLGLIEGETIAMVPVRYRWNNTDASPAMYERPSKEYLGHGMFREVTAKDKVWKGRNIRSTELAKVTLTDRKVVTNAV